MAINHGHTKGSAPLWGVFLRRVVVEPLRVCRMPRFQMLGQELRDTIPGAAKSALISHVVFMPPSHEMEASQKKASKRPQPLNCSDCAAAAASWVVGGGQGRCPLDRGTRITRPSCRITFQTSSVRTDNISIDDAHHADALCNSMCGES